MDSRNIIDLRIILLGDSNIGKKSLAHRFKILNSTETREISLKDLIKKKKLPNKLKVTKLIKNNNQLSEEEKKDILKEDKRIDLMRFTKIFRMEINSIHVSFCPCPDAEILDYDYVPKDEDDENYEFEKEFKISIRNINKSIKDIIMRPPDDSRATIEILFLLCFDLSNFSSFENLVIYFSQINKNLNITKNDFKLALIGTKLDSKKPMKNEEKENFENFRKQLNLNYYEVSSLMFFNFEKFFEKLILDIYGDVFPFFQNEVYKNIFHNILQTKSDFTKTKRGELYAKNDIPAANKYYNDLYEYPKNKRDLIKIFKNKFRFNKKIFINKRSILFPPIKDVKEEMNSAENDKKNIKEFNEEFLSVNWDSLKNEKIQSVLELNSNKSGYSFGIKTNNSLELKKEREKMRLLKDKEIRDKLDGSIISGSQIMPIHSYKTSLSSEQFQLKYEQNRIDKRKKKSEKRKEIFDMMQERHKEMQLKNSRSFNVKISKIEEKEKKYENLRKILEKEKKIRKLNIMNANKKYNYKYFEPKGKFYDPISSISNKKGFTFGQKLDIKHEQKDSPDFPTFRDDFEKLIEKNKKKQEIKSLGSRFPVYKTEENGDSSYIMEKQKDFEKKRKRFRTMLFSDFFDNRKDKRGEVINNKKLISERQEKKLNEQIKKSYKTDENYLIRDINYNQIENSSPKYTIKGKYSSTLFTQNYKDDEYNNKRFATISGDEVDYENRLSKPNLGAIYPRYPAFSFGSAKRFDFEKSSKKKKNEINSRYDDYFNTYDIFRSYKDTQSFLMAQTTMGTSEKLKMEDNGNPGPGMYKIRGFADDISLRGTKINLTRIKMKEKEKAEEMDKERRAKLREEWFQERKSHLKMGIKDYISSSKIKLTEEKE